MGVFGFGPPRGRPANWLDSSSVVAFFFFGSRFGDNLPRLLGIHRLTARRASDLLGVSPQALSDWGHSKRRPEPETLERISKFFELPPDRLADADFEDLLVHELADASRFRLVETKIQKHSAP
jgi:transcriptional regulator with XRE-family HTH domain